MKAMITLGITGGIGSGKSTVTKLLAEQGLPVIDADLVARQVMMPGHPVLARVVEVFGADLLDADGNLDRQALANRAFADAKSTEQLNSITHPAIKQLVIGQQETYRQQGEEHLILDHPLLIESNYLDAVDYVAVVVVDVETRIQRLQQHRGIQESDARQRIARQLSDEQRCKHADFIIDNNGTPADLETQVAHMWQQLREAAS